MTTRFPIPGPMADADLSARRRSLLLGSAAAGLLWGAGMPARAQAGLALTLAGTAFEHRWSRAGQHEFTPAGQTDLNAWHDMLTLNVHDAARSGEALADLANAVLARYREHGKVMVTRSVPRTPTRPAEHLIVAVLGQPKFLEAAFARLVLHDGAGLVAVRSHRVYGPAVGPEMGRWLTADGQRTETTLMAWNPLPPVATLRRLPQA